MKWKIVIGLLLMFLVLGIACAAHNNEIFTAPAGLQAMGYNDFVDGQGHNINIFDHDDSLHKTWFENDTEHGYYVQPYEGNNSFYIYSNDDNDCGVLEIVEKDGKQYIINSWTPNGSAGAKEVVHNLYEFNRLNHLTPIPIEG